MYISICAVAARIFKHSAAGRSCASVCVWGVCGGEWGVSERTASRQQYTPTGAGGGGGLGGGGGTASSAAAAALRSTALHCASVQRDAGVYKGTLCERRADADVGRRRSGGVGRERRTDRIRGCSTEQRQLRPSARLSDGHGRRPRYTPDIYTGQFSLLLVLSGRELGRVWARGRSKRREGEERFLWKEKRKEKEREEKVWRGLPVEDAQVRRRTHRRAVLGI